LPVPGHLVVDDRHPASTLPHDRGVVVADHLVGHATETLEAPEHRRQQVGDGPTEGEHRGVGSRVRQRRHEPEGLAGGSLADRDLPARVPPVDLGDLPGQVGGALETAGGEELRAHIRQVLLQDRDATRVADPTQLLQHHGGGHLRIGIEHRGDLIGERIDQRAGGLALIGRRSLERQQPPHRHPAHPQPLRDRGLREPLLVEPSYLGPVVHAIHPVLLGSREDPSIGRNWLRPGRVVSFRPATGG
jgi:hypothetical protein